jgi:hypothetical protein
MLFVCGVADKRGLRNIFSGTTQACGTVRQVANFTPRGADSYEYDWGESALPDAAVRTARAILSSVTNYATASRLAEEYAQDVVMQMESGRMWMLFSGEIELWLQARVKVA